MLMACKRVIKYIVIYCVCTSYLYGVVAFVIRILLKNQSCQVLDVVLEDSKSCTILM